MCGTSSVLGSVQGFSIEWAIVLIRREVVYANDVTETRREIAFGTRLNMRIIYIMLNMSDRPEARPARNCYPHRGRQSGKSPVNVAQLTLTILIMGSGTLAAAANRPSDAYRVHGLEQPAEILIDEWGVPHIYAKTHYDAFFVQGFNAARDRLWQIDSWRRRGLGEAVRGSWPGVRRHRTARRDCFSIAATCTANGSRTGPTRSASPKHSSQASTRSSISRKRNRCCCRRSSNCSAIEPAHWTASDIVRIRSNGLWRNLTNEVERARILCAFPASVDSLHKKLEPAWNASHSGGPRSLQRPGERSRRLSARESADFVHESCQRARRRRAKSNSRTGIGSNNWVVVAAAHRYRPADPRKRSASRTRGSVASLRGSSRGARPQRHRRGRTGAARHLDRPQRAHRVRVDDLSDRPGRPLRLRDTA